MQYSKAEKGEYSESQILKKLQRLKQQISSSEDYHKLQKCSSKLEKVQSNVATLLDKKSRKDLRGTVEVLQGLIKEKTKYFKKKVIQQLNSQSKYDHQNSKDKTLKYSKSVQNFQMLPPYVQPPRKQLLKNEEEQWANKTQIQVRNQHRLQEVVDQLRQEVYMYKNRVALLQNPTNILTYKLGEQSAVFQRQTGLKLKERGLQVEELKGRLRYYQQTNQELRNRLTNEQKRQEDYISNLKNHISRMNNQMEVLSRDNRKTQDELSRQHRANKELERQIKQLVEESQLFQRQRHQRQQSQILKMNSSAVRKELQMLSQQEKYIRDMENVIQGQKDENNVLKEQIETRKKAESRLYDQITSLQRQRQKLSEVLQISVQEIDALKKELSLTLELNHQGEEELMLVKADISKMQKQFDRERLNKEMNSRKKTEHLKQIKQLLESK